MRRVACLCPHWPVLQVNHRNEVRTQDDVNLFSASLVVATYIRHLDIHRDPKYSSLDGFRGREEAALRSTGSLHSLSIAGIYFDFPSGSQRKVCLCDVTDLVLC